MHGLSNTLFLNCSCLLMYLLARSSVLRVCDIVNTHTVTFLLEAGGTSLVAYGERCVEGEWQEVGRTMLWIVTPFPRKLCNNSSKSQKPPHRWHGEGWDDLARGHRSWLAGLCGIMVDVGVQVFVDRMTLVHRRFVGRWMRWTPPLGDACRQEEGDVWSNPARLSFCQSNPPREDVWMEAHYQVPCWIHCWNLPHNSALLHGTDFTNKCVSAYSLRLKMVICFNGLFDP